MIKHKHQKTSTRPEDKHKDQTKGTKTDDRPKDQQTPTHKHQKTNTKTQRAGIALGKQKSTLP